MIAPNLTALFWMLYTRVKSVLITAAFKLPLTRWNIFLNISSGSQNLPHYSLKKDAMSTNLGGIRDSDMTKGEPERASCATESPLDS